MISGKITKPEKLIGHMKKSSPQITGEINNSNPILAGIGQSQGGNRHAVAYIEQELTDEERAQARRNIAKYQWDWRKVSAGNLVYTVADFSKWYNIDNTLDMDAALALTSLSSTNYNSVALLAQHASFICSLAMNGDSRLTAFMDRFVNEYERLRAEGILTGYLYLAFYDSYNDDVHWAFAFSTDNNYASFSIIDLAGRPFCKGNIYYNLTDKTYTNNIHNVDALDDTLSIIGYAAQAKAVGDALATKVSFTEAQELTDEQKEIAKTNIGLEFTTDDEIIELLMILDMFPVVIDFDGGILADENSNILLW